MAIIRLTLTILGCLTILSPFATTQAGSLDLSAGIGYDYFSQDYHLDSLTTDTLEATLALSSTYFDDLKGLIRLGYAPGARRSMLLTGRVEQSANDLRFRGGFESSLKANRLKLVTELDYDLRSDLESPSDSSKSYWTGIARQRVYYSLGEQSRIKLEFKGDLTRFSHPDTYSRDYSRAGGRIGYEGGFGFYSSYSIDLFLTHREVPDSVAWNYENQGVEGALYWLRDKGETDIYGRWENKDYNQPDNLDDFDRLEVSLNNQEQTGNWLTFKQLAALEKVSFAADDPLSFDFTKLTFSALAGYHGLDGSILGGVWTEWLQENNLEAADTLIGTQAYRELGLRVEADYMSLKWGYLSLVSTYGRRTLTGEVPIESDFTFSRSDLIADVPIWKGMKGSLLLGTEWEWHTNESEDIRVILFSGGFNYSF